MCIKPHTERTGQSGELDQSHEGFQLTNARVLIRAVN